MTNYQTFYFKRGPKNTDIYYNGHSLALIQKRNTHMGWDERKL